MYGFVGCRLFRFPGQVHVVPLLSLLESKLPSVATNPGHQVKPIFPQFGMPVYKLRLAVYPIFISKENGKMHVLSKQKQKVIHQLSLASRAGCTSAEYAW